MHSLGYNLIRSFQKDILHCCGSVTSKREIDFHIALLVIPSSSFQDSTLYLKMVFQQPQISPKQLCQWSAASLTYSLQVRLAQQLQN